MASLQQEASRVRTTYLTNNRLNSLTWDSAGFALGLAGFAIVATPVGIIATGAYVLSVYGMVHNGLFLFIDLSVGDKDLRAINEARSAIGLVGRSAATAALITGFSNDASFKFASRAQSVSDVALGFRDFHSMGSGPSLFSLGVNTAQWIKNEVDWATSSLGGDRTYEDRSYSNYMIDGWREHFDPHYYYEKSMNVNGD